MFRIFGQTYAAIDVNISTLRLLVAIASTAPNPKAKLDIINSLAVEDEKESSIGNGITAKRTATRHNNSLVTFLIAVVE